MKNGDAEHAEFDGLRQRREIKLNYTTLNNSTLMKTFLCSLVALFALGSCGNNPDTPTDTELIDGEIVAREVPLSNAVTQAWSASTAAYLELKEALVASDLPAAQRAANQLSAAISGADMAAMGEAHDKWMKTAPSVGAAAQQIETASTIEAAREAFSALTPPMVAAIRELGDGGRDLFIQHCPMAFDNAGADWVSSEREIRNPYYGDAMLTCGKVTEEL